MATGQNPDSSAWAIEAGKLYDQLLPTPQDKEALNAAIGDLFTVADNPYIDNQQLQTEVDAIFKQFSEGAGGGDITWLTDQFAALDDKMLASSATAGTLGDSLQEIQRNLDFKWQIDDMRIEGLDETADELVRVNDLIGQASDLVPLLTERTSAYNELMLQGAGSVAEASEGLTQYVTASGLTVEQMENIWKAQDRINAVMQSGNVNNEAVIADIAALTAQYQSGAITAEQYEQGIFGIAGRMSDYVYTAEDATGATVALTVAIGALDSAIVGAAHGDGNDYLQNVLARIAGIDFSESAQGLADAGIQAGLAAQKMRDFGQGVVDSSGSLATAAVEAVAYKEAMTAAGDAGAIAFDSLASGAHDATDDMDVFGARVHDMGVNALNAASDIAATVVEMAELAKSVMGVDTFAEEWNIAGLGSDFNDLAVDILRAGDAADSTFNAIVTNTDAIAQNAQGVADWAEGLRTAGDELAVVDQLLASGRIDQGQYDAALTAFDQIVAANERIQTSVQDIQTTAAPVLAQMQQQQANYMDQLAGLPAQQQLIALGWMDVNTSTRANEILTMAAAAASGELGEKGRRATEQMIAGAAAADPVLAALLEDMGLIEQGADGTITVTMDGAEGAMSDLDQLTQSVYMLIDVLDDGVINGSVSIETAAANAAIEATTGILAGFDGKTATTHLGAEDLATGAIQAANDALAMIDGKQSYMGINAYDYASEVIGGAKDALTSTDGLSALVSVYGDSGDAQGAVGAAKNALGSVDGNSASTYVYGDSSDAQGAVGAAKNALGSVDGNSASTYVYGDASDALGSIYQMAKYNGSVISTSYADIVTRHYSIYSSAKAAHGGTVGHFAGGGMVPFWAGENGPEIAHFAGGGSALIPTEGMYAAPPMTYISPSNAVSNTSYGGAQVTININGPVFGIDDLSEKILRQIGPAIAQATERHQRGQGRV